MTQPSSPKEIVDIRVVSESEKTQVVVEGQQPMIYTTFHLTDPYRLIVDMAGVSLGKFTEKIDVNQGGVRSILPVSGDGNQVGRLEIEVDESVETNVRTEGTNLIVEAAHPASKPAEPVVEKPVEPILAFTEEPKPVLPPPIKEERNLSPAKIVKSVRFDRKEDLQLVITLDGQPSPNVFLLDPKRLVIDLPDVKMASKIKTLPVKDHAVKQARIGVHSDKVRLVLDLNAPVVYSLQQAGPQLRVHLKDASEAASSSKTEEPANSSVPEDVSAAPATAVIVPPVVPMPEAAVPNMEVAALVDPSVDMTESTEVAAAPASAPIIDTKAVEKPSLEAPKMEAPAERVADKADIILENGEVSEEPKKSAETGSVTPPKYVGRRISLDFQDADLANVIRLIADVSNLNIVLGEDVKGKVTLKLINVPWDQALDIILRMNSFGQIREGNIIRIATLSNIAQQQDEEARAKETKIKAEDLQTRIIYVNYGKAADLVDSLRKLLSTRGDITVDGRTNALIVKDIEKNLDEVARLVKTIDTQTPQVVIEARIVQVSPTFNRSLGIQWGASTQTVSGGNIIGLRGGGGGPGAIFGTPDPSFAVNLPSAQNFGGLGFSFGRFTDNPINLDLRLSAGESQGLTRVVSTPKVSVLNNQEAKIEQGESIPFSTTSQAGTQTTFVDANLTLLVTPHISSDGGIMMKIKVTKNAPGETRFGASGPSILKKEATTNVLVKDGETTVIGGIYETTKSDSINGIPYLMDIPFLGWLFKTTTKREDTSELLVFLTPRILK
ncbi:type IV pilus secretin family protein [Candidatus Manganitrophus noduliformans]|nr:type IV pilus secretin family protein [Candidatus Manganitrophus noduliformans]